MTSFKLVPTKRFEHLVRWTYPDNYAGETFKEYYRTGIGQSRDSGALEKSNFESMLRELGGETETVVVQHSGHWAVGWVETILIHESDTQKLELANEIMSDFKNYPVIDEDHFCETEREEFSEYAESAKNELASALCLHLGFEELEETPDMLELAYHLNMYCQEYSGGDYCVNIYDCREPDASDWDRVVRLLHDMGYYMKDNQAYDLVCACLNVEVTK